MSGCGAADVFPKKAVGEDLQRAGKTLFDCFIFPHFIPSFHLLTLITDASLKSFSDWIVPLRP